MAVISLIPVDDEEEFPSEAPLRKFLTFVVPAPEGCNLKCGFCFIRQRREMPGATAASPAPTLAPLDYARFIREAAAATPVHALAIQGYEPLLPAALPYTQAILATAQRLGIPASLVTNGVFLRDALSLLKILAPTKIGISLDFADASTHDRLRGVPGTWAAVVDGIAAAAAALAPRTSLAVGSVLLPPDGAQLDGMPALLSSLGVKHWIVTPLQKVGGEQPGGPAGDRPRLYRNLLRLQAAADRANIRLTIDDELNCLQHDLASARNPELRSLRVRTIPAGVELVRLVPSGHYSTGRDILRQVTAATPRWQPEKTGAAFP